MMGTIYCATDKGACIQLEALPFSWSQTLATIRWTIPILMQVVKGV